MSLSVLEFHLISEGHHGAVEIFLNVIWLSLPSNVKWTVYKLNVKRPLVNKDIMIS